MFLKQSLMSWLNIKRSSFTGKWILNKAGCIFLKAVKNPIKRKRSAVSCKKIKNMSFYYSLPFFTVSRRSLTVEDNSSIKMGLLI
jgi:hypothetical protein